MDVRAVGSNGDPSVLPSLPGEQGAQRFPGSVIRQRGGGDGRVADGFDFPGREAIELPCSLERAEEEQFVIFDSASERPAILVLSHNRFLLPGEIEKIVV